MPDQNYIIGYHSIAYRSIPYIHTYIHTYACTYLPAYLHTCTYLHAYVRRSTYIGMRILSNIQTCLHAGHRHFRMCTQYSMDMHSCRIHELIIRHHRPEQYSKQETTAAYAHVCIYIYIYIFIYLIIYRQSVCNYINTT